MMDGFWTKNTTWRARYDDFGATGYMFLHAKGMDDAVVIDVGCSKGEAIAESKKCLGKHGIRLHTVGIDMSDKSKLITKAENNLDEFVNKNALEVDGYVGKADIVVCLNTIHKVLGHTKSDMIKKCASFLKPDGVFITNVSEEYRDMLKLEAPAPTQPKRVCAGWGWWTLGCRHTDTRMMNQDTALCYAEMILTDWDKMDSWRKETTRFYYHIRRWFSNYMREIILFGIAAGVTYAVCLPLLAK